MLLKQADDKSRRIALLEDLRKSHAPDLRQKWLTEELRRLRMGIQDEKDSAYHLDHYFMAGRNHVVLHGLRFVLDGGNEICR